MPQTDGLLHTPLKEPDPEQGGSFDKEEEEEGEVACVGADRQIAHIFVSLLFANSNRAHTVFGTKPKGTEMGTFFEIKR